MAKDAAHLHPGDDPKKIQAEVDACDVVYFHADGGDGSGRFDLDGGAIRLHPGNGTQKRIIGVPRQPKSGHAGQEAAERPILFTRPDKSQVTKDGGVFDIRLGKATLDVENLDLRHEFAIKADPAATTLGTSTVAVTVDNSLPSTFRMTDCRIHTFASAGILVRSINSHDSPVAARHEIAIRGCAIRGDGSLGRPVNYSAVTIDGALTAERVQLRGSRFEVSGCTLDPELFAGVALLHFDSDAASRFVIAHNTIGGRPGATSHGVWIGNEHPPSSPRGVVEIAHNRIAIGREHPEALSCSGVFVQVGNGDPEQSLWTWIRDNEIRLPLSLGKATSRDGIVYEDVKDRVSRTYKGYRDPVSGMGSFNSGAVVEHNKVYNPDPEDVEAPAFPMRGIRVGGRGSHVVVRDNDLLGLVATEAHIALAELACSNLVRGNVLGRIAGEGAAGIECEGDGTLIVENDFRACAAPGWTPPSHSGGPGCVRLGPGSSGNHVTFGKGELPRGTSFAQQYWDQGHGNTAVDAAGPPTCKEPGVPATR